MTPDRHPGFGIPSNARYRQHAHPFREWERTDPGYAEHRPLERADFTRWREWSLALGLFGVVCLAILAMSIVGWEPPK